MPSFDVWDVVKVPFPYTSRLVQQRRPAIVVATVAAPGVPDLLWVVMVTSAANRGWPGDVTITDLAMAGLPVASVVRTAKIATIDASAAETIGRLPQSDRADIVAALKPTLAAFLESLER